MLEKIGKDLEKTNAKEELFSLRKKSWGLNVLAKKTTRRNKKKSLKQLKFKQADFEESYSPLNCSASFLWESASFLLFWLSAVKKKKKTGDWNIFLLIKPSLPSTYKELKHYNNCLYSAQVTLRGRI